MQLELNRRQELLLLLDRLSDNDIKALHISFTCVTKGTFDRLAGEYPRSVRLAKDDGSDLGLAIPGALILAPEDIEAPL